MTRGTLRRTVRTRAAHARSQDGVAIVMALIVLLSLSGLVLAFLSMTALEPLISQNLADATTARLLADSGIDLAYDTLVRTTDWSTVIAAATTRSCAAADPGIFLVPAGTPLPGWPAAHGTFGVRVRNDCQPGDDKLTGTVIETGRPNADGNGRLVLQSTGLKNGAARTVSVVAFRVRMFELDATLAFPGLQANVDFPASTFVIDGRDTRPGDAVDAPTGAGAPKFGITVAQSGSIALTAIQAALRSAPQNHVVGRDPNGAGLVTGEQAVTASATLTSQQVADFAGAVKGMADVTIDVAAGASYARVGSTCAANVSDTRCWGTDTHPKIVYVRGGPTPLDLTEGATGTGILIVENGILNVLGDLRWHGPIIVTGTNVGLRFLGTDQSVHGGVVVNERRADGIVSPDAGVRGTARLSYSKDAMDLVLAGLSRRMTTTMNWREK